MYYKELFNFKLTGCWNYFHQLSKMMIDVIENLNLLIYHC